MLRLQRHWRSVWRAEREQPRSWVVRQALVRDMHVVTHHGAYTVYVCQLGRDVLIVMGVRVWCENVGSRGTVGKCTPRT